MKKLLCLMLCLLLTCVAPACAEGTEVPLLGPWAPFFAYPVGEDLCVTTWCPLPEGTDPEQCFVVAEGYDSEGCFLFTTVLQDWGARITRQELLDFLLDQFGWTQEQLLADGYAFDAEQYLIFRHRALVSLEEAPDVRWLNLLIYAEPEGTDLPLLPFIMGAADYTWSADGLTVTGLMRNDCSLTCSPEAITGALLIDGDGRAVLAKAQGYTVPARVEDGEETPVTFTAEVEPGFDLSTVIPVCEADWHAFASMEDLGMPQSDIAFGMSGELCFRLSVPYREGTDPADYCLLSLSYSLEGGVLAAHFFQPGEGVLVDGRVEFPLIPMYVGEDASVNAYYAWLVTGGESTK